MKAVILKLLNPRKVFMFTYYKLMPKQKFTSLVEKAYDQDSPEHRLIRKNAEAWYGLHESKLNSLKAEALLRSVFDAQHELYNSGHKKDLGNQKIGVKELMIRCYASESNTSRVYLQGFDDNLTIYKIYQNHISEGSIALDIGANVGMHSLVMSECVGSKGTVYSYEPRPSMCERINENISLNKVDNVIVRSVGVGEENGFLSFNENGDEFNIGNGKFESGGKNKLSIVRLDNELRAIQGKVDLIKIDVEGMELSVLKGARNTLAKHKPFIVIESNPNDWKISDLASLIPYDFEVYGIPATFKDTMKKIRSDMQMYNYNNLLIKPV